MIMAETEYRSLSCEGESGGGSAAAAAAGGRTIAEGLPGAADGRCMRVARGMAAEDESRSVADGAPSGRPCQALQTTDACAAAGRIAAGAGENAAAVAEGKEAAGGDETAALAAGRAAGGGKAAGGAQAAAAAEGRASAGDADNGVAREYSSVCPSLILVDWYQLAMMYANWREGKHKQRAVFEAFFRKAPFSGEFAVMAGVKQMVEFLLSMSFSYEHMQFFRRQFPGAPEEFFHYLSHISVVDVSVHAIPEGTIVFPKVPLVRVEGPLAVCQLVETPILNILNYAVLVATNAARHRLAAGLHKQLLEFGARRAQGPNGALSASRYAYLGGFDATSNTEASFLYGIPLRGTMAHSFVTSFTNLKQLRRSCLLPNPAAAAGALQGHQAAENNSTGDFIECVEACRARVVALWPEMNLGTMMHQGELAAFAAFAQTFPHAFLALVDTFDTLFSGIPNAIAVAMALLMFGYQPVGVRLDSGDLSYLSQEARRMFREAAAAFDLPQLERLTIVASNDLNEIIIAALNNQGHEIDAFAIGTNLVTCQAQPALGMVYKLVELDGKPCMKVSQDFEKTSLPSKKDVFRFYTRGGAPALDLLQETSAPAPVAGEKIFCRHLYDDRKRCFFVPSKVERLLLLYIEDGKKKAEPRSLEEARAACLGALRKLRSDLTRQVNPTPFKGVLLQQRDNRMQMVSASESYYRFFHRMWQSTAPVRTIE